VEDEDLLRVSLEDNIALKEADRRFVSQ